MHFILIFISLISYQISTVASQFNLSAYHQMPALFILDDYDACLTYDGTENGTYCTVFGSIVPNKTSALWQQIDIFSSDSNNFRHDILVFGVCINRCLGLLATLNQTAELNPSHKTTITDTHLLKYYSRISSTDYHQEYGSLLETCINRDFRNKFELSVQTMTVSCDKNNVTQEYGNLEIALFTIIICFGIAIIYSTLYDFVLKHKQTAVNKQNNDFYKMQLQSNEHIFMTSFSLCRNYYRIALPSKNPAIDDFSFINGLRCVSIFLTIAAHSILVLVAMPSVNKEFIEERFHGFEGTLLRNGTVVTQIFFVISSFLLYYNLTKKKLITPQTSTGKCMSMFFKLSLHRYLRLAPTLMFIVLLNAVILPHFQLGPLWEFAKGAESKFCRDNWWKHALFINNFLVVESCLHQTWQLAADFQLHIMFLIIIIVFEKYPKLKTPLLTFLGVLSLVIPALLTYLLEIDATSHFKPEYYRYLDFKDTQSFFHITLPFYTNFGSYLAGIFCVDLYRKLRHNRALQELNNRLTYEILWWLIFPGFCGLLIGASLFTAYEWKKPSLWVAVFALLYHNVWDVLCLVLILGMCLKLGWVVYEFCNLHTFHSLAKISYQTFLGHTLVLRFLYGYFRQPVYLNYLQLNATVVLGYVVSNIFGFFLALFIEYPMAELIKLFFKVSSAVNTDENIAMNSNIKNTRSVQSIATLDQHKPNLRHRSGIN